MSYTPKIVIVGSDADVLNLKNCYSESQVVTVRQAMLLGIDIRAADGFWTYIHESAMPLLTDMGVFRPKLNRRERRELERQQKKKNK